MSATRGLDVLYAGTWYFRNYVKSVDFDAAESIVKQPDQINDGIRFLFLNFFRRMLNMYDIILNTE